MNTVDARPWTDDEIRETATMWKDGLSATEIGAKVGRTRSAVLGAMRRAGETSPSKVRVKKATSVSAKTKAMGTSSGIVRRVAIAKEPQAFAVDNRYLRESHWAPLPASTPVRLDQHTRGCRWPVTMPGPDYWYCNLEPSEGSSYCQHHAAMVAPPRPRVEPAKPASKADRHFYGGAR